jgi:hypothetical protein
VYRPLPPRSNFEHLRKEAKAVLRAVGREKGWRLADAQHAVARGYGFPSWPKLKAHVESVAPAPGANRVASKRRSQDTSRAQHRISGTWSTSKDSTNQHIMLSVNAAGDVITFTSV